jgi:hypothetical protein
MTYIPQVQGHSDLAYFEDLGLISKEALDSSNSAVSNDFYMTNQTSTTQLHKRTGGSWTTLGTDATIYTAIIVSTPAFGTALYVEDGTQKMFMKFGSTSEWFPILSATDGDSTSFQSVAIWTSALNMRCTTPFMVWGA